jgi:hypothetical protein
MYRMIKRTLFVSVIFAIGFISCKKNGVLEPTKTEQRAELTFFKTDNGVRPSILKIQKNLIELNKSKPFVDEFVRMGGYPRWDKGFYLVKNGLNQRMQSSNSVIDSTFIIPVVSQNNKVVTGALIAKIGYTSSYNLVLLKDYKSQNNNKANFVKAMMILDAKVYGYNKFGIKDSSLFSNTKEVFFKKAGTSVSSSKVTNTESDDPCDIVEIWWNPDEDACNCSGDEYYTGEWHYADEENCLNGQGSVMVFLVGGGGGGGLDPGNPTYYPIPTLGGGTGGGGSNSNLPYNPIPSTEQQKTDYLIEQLNLNPTQQFYLTNNDGLVNNLFNYLYNNPYIRAKELSIWAISYLAQNPNVKFSDFEKWFLKAPQGIDGDYDIVYWSNPSLTFPPQTLPTFSDFSNAYPKHEDPLFDTPEKLYTDIGGDVLSLYNSNPPKYQNTCALRISKALNGSGVNIPAGKDRFKGADGKYYFLSAAALLNWMIKTFGMPTGANKLTGSQGGTNGENFPTLLSNKNGIYIMIPNYPGGCPTASNPNGTGFCASGHADLLTNGVCDGGCYFNPTGGVEFIFIWILP